MGLLSQGQPLAWSETKTHAEHVRKHGIVQFINLYKKLKNRQGGSLTWGDEVRRRAACERLNIEPALRKSALISRNANLRFDCVRLSSG